MDIVKGKAFPEIFCEHLQKSAESGVCGSKFCFRWLLQSGMEGFIPFKYHAKDLLINHF